MRTRIHALLVVLAFTLVGAAPSGTGGAPPASTPAMATVPSQQVIGTVGLQFHPSQLTIEAGDALTHANADIAPHDVTSTARDANGNRLFSGATIPGGQTAPVDGVADLPPGTYGFFCTVHPTTMSGTLEVVPRTTPPTPTPPVPTVAAVATPTSITVHDGTLYAASWAQGTIEAFPILTAGLLGPGETYATGFSSPLGIVFDDDGWLYVSDSHPATTPGRGTAGRVWAVPPGGGDAGAVGEIVLDELPNGRHNTNGLAIHNGRLYVTNGNSTDDGVAGGDPEQPLSGSLVSVRLGARDLGPDDAVFQLDEEEPIPDLFVEATGMRNNFDVAFRPGTAEAWMSVNGPDELDPYGEDTLVADRNVDDIRNAPTHFGFPECVYADLGETWDVTQNPEVTTACGAHTPPEQLLGLHVALTGLAFGPDGDLVVARFGNFFGDRPVGRDLVRIEIDEDGRAGEPQSFVVLPAPLDVTFNGADLYVADFALGQVLLLRGL